MFDELKDLNFTTCSGAELKTLVCQIIPDLQAQATRELLRRFDNNSSSQTIISEPSIIAIANGHRLSGEEFKNINEENFDVILDMTTNSLRFRRFPSKRSKLETPDLRNLGAQRREILVYLLEHPKRFISVKNIPTLARQCAIVESNTLAKSINIIRKALGQHKNTQDSYIITEASFGSANCVYKLNPEWNYLVIKENQKSLINHSKGKNKVI